VRLAMDGEDRGLRSLGPRFSNRDVDISSPLHRKDERNALQTTLSRIEQNLGDLISGQSMLQESIQEIHSSLNLGVPRTRGLSHLSMRKGHFGALIKQASATDVSESQSSVLQPAVSFCGSAGMSAVASDAVSSVVVRDSTKSEHSTGFVASTLPIHWPNCLQLREGLRTSRITHRKSSVLPWLNASKTQLLSTKSEQDDDRIRVHCYIIHPDSSAHAVLDCLATAFVVYELLVTPYAVAWHVEPSGWLLVTYWCSAVFWLCDMLLGFFTGFYENGSVQLRPSRIRQHYLRGWFIADFLLVAADLLSMIAQAFDIQEGGHLLRLLRLSRLCRVVSIAKVSRLFLRLEDFFQAHHAEMFAIFMKLARIAVVVLGANHLIACFWMVIGRDGYSDTGRRWVEELAFASSNAPTAPSETTYLDLEPVYQYSVTFHWALTQITLGSSPVGSYNSMEQIFSSACLTVGLLMGTTLISMFSAEMVEAQVMTRQRDVMTNQLCRFLRQQHVDRRLALNVRAMVRERLKKVPPLAKHEVTGLQLLPSKLALELNFELCGRSVLSHPIFAVWHSLSRSSVMRLCMDGVTHGYSRQNDEVFSAGAAAERVYYLKSGMGSYDQVPESAPVSDDVSVPVESPFWLAEAAFWMHWLHVGTFRVTALGVSEVLEVPVQVVLTLMQQNAILQDVTVDYCKHYHAQLTKSVPPFFEYPNDLEVPRTSFEDILFSMDPSTVHGIAQSTISLIRRQSLAAALSSFGMNTIWADLAEELKMELAKGDCVVFMSGRDTVRCVSFTAKLRVEKDDRRVLMHAGDMSAAGKVTIVAAYPGSRQVLGESAEAAMRRVIANHLQALKLDVEACLGIRKQTFSRASKKSPCWCKQTMFHAPANTFDMGLLDNHHLQDSEYWSAGNSHSRPSMNSLPNLGRQSTAVGWLRGSVSPSAMLHFREAGAKSSTDESGQSSSASPYVAVSPLFALKHHSAVHGEAAYGLYMWVPESHIEFYQTDQGRVLLESRIAAQDPSEVERSATGGRNLRLSSLSLHSVNNGTADTSLVGSDREETEQIDVPADVIEDAQEQTDYSPPGRFLASPFQAMSVLPAVQGDAQQQKQRFSGTSNGSHTQQAVVVSEMCF